MIVLILKLNNRQTDILYTVFIYSFERNLQTAFLNATLVGVEYLNRSAVWHTQSAFGTGFFTTAFLCNDGSFVFYIKRLFYTVFHLCSGNR